MEIFPLIGRALRSFPLERVLFPSRNPQEEMLKYLEAERLTPPAEPPPPGRPAREVTPDAVISQEMPAANAGVSTAETMAYQKRQIGKQLLLMEIHLQQGCKIAGKACDCCEKHPMVIEGMAEEALGMTGDHVYADLMDWSRKIAPMTTAAASASGKYDGIYPGLAVEGRQYRKRIMGSAESRALLTPKEAAKVDAKVEEVMARLTTTEEADHDGNDNAPGRDDNAPK